MISETDLNLYSFTSTATIFGPNKSVICIFIEIHRDRSAYTASRVTPPHSIHLCFLTNKIMIAQKWPVENGPKTSPALLHFFNTHVFTQNV